MSQVPSYRIYRVEPRPPATIPTVPPDAGTLRPAPNMPITDWTSKPLLKSRTIITVLFTILFFAAGKFFGLDVDWKEAVGEDYILTLGELITLIGLTIAAYFRKKATGPIEGVIKPPSEG